MLPDSPKNEGVEVGTGEWDSCSLKGVPQSLDPSCNYPLFGEAPHILILLSDSQENIWMYGRHLCAPLDWYSAYRICIV